MKYILFTLFLGLVSFDNTPETEKFFVTFVKGNVLLGQNKKQIKIGDVILINDKLYFSDQTSKISCISPSRGRFDISKNSNNKKSKSEFFSILEANLIKPASNHSLSTRSVIFEGNNPGTYFKSPETQNKILLIDDMTIKINSSYKLDENNFFFIQYELNGKVTTTKIPHNLENLIFNRNLVKWEINSLNNVKLCYQYTEKNLPKSRVITEFIPVFVEYNEILSQVEIIQKVMNGKKKNEIKKEIINHLFDNYGSIGSEEIYNLFKIN